jgi:predicted Zn-dependent protease
MRKNNTNKSKPNSERSAKASSTRKSTPSKRASNGKPTPLEESGSRASSAPSSTWTKALADNPAMADLFQEAIDLNRADKAKDAARLLEKLVLEFPSHAALWGYLGGIYRIDLKRPLKALRCFRRATELSPKSERASLGVFHTLWELNRQDQALEEIKRYQVLTDWSCQDYLEIMEEIKEKWVEPSKAKKPAKTKR